MLTIYDATEVLSGTYQVAFRKETAKLVGRFNPCVAEKDIIIQQDSIAA